MSDGEIDTHDLRQGDWSEALAGMDASVWKDGVNIIDEGWRHFWAQNEVEAFVYDGYGNIIEVERTDKPREMPKSRSWFSNPWGDMRKN